MRHDDILTTARIGKYFKSTDDVDEWIMLNALRILKNNKDKSYYEAVEVSMSQLKMDANTEWYDEIRFSLEDLQTKSTDELNKQQKAFVIKNITPHFI